MRESQQLPDFVASMTFSDIPADVIERMKLYLPAQWDDVADKFCRCSQRVIAPERQQRVIGTVRSLDTLPNAGELMALVRSAD